MVVRRGCCILMRGVLASNMIYDRKVYVADSFQGLPPPKPAFSTTKPTRTSVGPTAA
jgi:Macrocin-O-methyltransferase (TylF)